MNTLAPAPQRSSASSKPAKPAGFSNWINRLANLRFASVSLIIHAIIVLLGGSVVLFTAKPPVDDFVAGDGTLVDPGDQSAQAPTDVPQPNALPQFEAASASLPTVDAITTSTMSPTAFQLDAGPAVAKLDGTLANLPAGGKGMADKVAGLGGLGGGMKGGSIRSFFGMKDTSRGVGLVGTFYDAKQTRGRKPTNMDVNQFGQLITKFVEDGWKESVLNDYYKAPAPLYSTQIFIPNMSANEGPKAFEVDKEVQPSRWLVHYKGKVSPPKDGNFRFVGAGDDYLVVRLNGKVVLDHGFAKATKWQPERFYQYGWTGVPNGFARGDKFRAVAGQYYDLEVLVSERPGGLVFFCLMLEDQDAEYQKDGKGNPILPVFRMADGPFPELEKGQTLPPYQAVGPIWKSAPLRSTGSSFSQIFGAK